MKNIVCIVVGLILLICSMIIPFPTILAIPGIVWRIMIGLMGCLLLALGFYQTVKKKNVKIRTKSK